MRIILASTSPRRRCLLQQIGMDFEVVPSSYKEEMHLKLPFCTLAKRIAYGKAHDVAKRLKEGIVIGADTFFVLNNKEIIGKPKTRKNAIATLRKISGKTLKVYSGIAIIDFINRRAIKDCEMTEVR